MKDLIKKQEEEFDKKFVSDSCVGTNDNLDDYELFMTNVKVRDIKKLIKEFRKEWTEAVCDKLVGKRYILEEPTGRALGYNDRIEQEEILKKQIIENV